MSGKRPKGYMHDWKPQDATLVVLAQVNGVLEEYRDQLPMTARQVFYRLVGQYGYDKTEQAYARLCEYLVKARRAGMIPFSAIRDDGTVSKPAGGYDSPEQWWESELYAAQGFVRDRSAGQGVRIELWCEAAGMAPMLAKAARPYGVSVYSTGGFSSVTVTHEVAQRVIGEDRPTVFMHVGDYDPSGESIFESMTEDIAAFVRDEGDPDFFEPDRIALTAQQVRIYSLPTAPPKKSDKRSGSWVGETCQAEAMDPKTLTSVVTNAIEARYDMDLFHRIAAEEVEQRNAIVAEVRRNLEARKR
jgi:hypothetical protein